MAEICKETRMSGCTVSW